MVFNSKLAVSVAKASADLWQFIACLPETINNQHLLDLVLCFPLHQFGRLALSLWNFLCVPSSSNSYYYIYSSYDNPSSSDSDSPVDFRRRVRRHDSQ